MTNLAVPKFNQMNSREILKYFESTRDEIVESICEIVEIESPSRDAKGIGKVVDLIDSQVKSISGDFKIERIFAESLGEHLIVRSFEEKNDAQILVLGHTDTVHPPGSKAKNPTRIENGKLFGCGTFDMKANIALFLAVLRCFSENGLVSKPFTLLLSCDEEIGSPTGREIVERESQNAPFCLVCEPSANGKVKTGRKGTGMFTLKTHGIPAHAGLEPEKGASAILEIARQISSIQALNDLDNGTTSNVCTIEGGTTSNVIPEFASCEIDVRFSKQFEAERVEYALRNLRPHDERVSLEIVGEINRPPMERTEEVVKLFQKAQKLAAEFDYELDETQVGGASDGNFVGALGVPVLDGLGIKGNGAHTLEEYIEIEDIAKRATLIAMLLLKD
jgi:glutamate carboxypeptidase